MKKRILAVDDELAITWLIKLNLEETGRYEVRTENQGAKAIAAAREFRPDLIILDVMMPDLLGSQIAEQLQADPELRAIKFIFLTAFVTKDEEQRLNARSAGHTMIAKPVSADELCRVVDEHLQQ